MVTYTCESSEEYGITQTIFTWNQIHKQGGRLEPYIRKDGQVGKTTQVAYIVKLIQHIVKEQSME